METWQSTLVKVWLGLSLRVFEWVRKVSLRELWGCVREGEKQTCYATTATEWITKNKKIGVVNYHLCQQQQEGKGRLCPCSCGSWWDSFTTLCWNRNKEHNTLPSTTKHHLNPQTQPSTASAMIAETLIESARDIQLTDSSPTCQQPQHYSSSSSSLLKQPHPHPALLIKESELSNTLLYQAIIHILLYHQSKCQLL